MVSTLVSFWATSMMSAAPSYRRLSNMADFTPNINASEWKQAIDDCLPQPTEEDEEVYIFDTPGLRLTDTLVNHFRAEPDVAVHWITMVVHSYLFSASSHKMQKMSASRTSKCEEYLKTIAPFAMQVLYSIWHTSVDEMEMARHILRMQLNASKSMFTWMPPRVRQHALERLQSIRVILGIPGNLYSPLAMDKYYSYLPVFKVPVVSSLLVAFHAKANFDIFNYQMTRFSDYSSVIKNRWRLQRARETSKEEAVFIGANAAFLPLYMLVLVPPVLLSEPFLDGTDIITSYAGIGRVMGHEMMHSFGR